METTASASSCHFVPVFPFRPDLPQKQPQMPQPPSGFPGFPANWLAEFETFASADGRATLFAQLFRPAQPSSDLAHRALFVLHGQGEHSGRYIHWPHYLHGVVGSIYAPDHRGHGRSSGWRGHIPDFDMYAHDAAQSLRRYDAYLRATVGRSEIHLVGHSMGGLIALRTLLLHPDLPVHSLTLSAPMLQLAFQLPVAKELAGKIFHKILPSVPLPTEPLADLVSRDPAVTAHYKADPLNHGFASTAFYYSYLAAKADTLQRSAELKLPLQMMLPLQDKIIAPEPTERFFESLKMETRRLVKYPELFHEIFNEPEKDQVFADLRKWLEERRQK